MTAGRSVVQQWLVVPNAAGTLGDSALFTGMEKDLTRARYRVFSSRGVLLIVGADLEVD